MSVFYFLLTLLYSVFVSATDLRLDLIATVTTPSSILTHKQDYTPLFVGARARYGTASGVVWFHDKYLASFNLLGQRADVYEFNETTKQFSHLQQFSQQDTGLIGPVLSATISPDETLLAVALCGENPRIVFYKIDQESHRIVPEQLASFPYPKIVHNLRFSADGRFLGAVSFDKVETINIYAVERLDNIFSCTRIQVIANPHLSTTANPPKVINFTQDGKFAIAAYVS